MSARATCAGLEGAAAAANPLRGLSAAELGRSYGTTALVDFSFKTDIGSNVQFGSVFAVRCVIQQCCSAIGGNRPKVVSRAAKSNYGSTNESGHPGIMWRSTGGQPPQLTPASPLLL